MVMYVIDIVGQQFCSTYFLCVCMQGSQFVTAVIQLLTVFPEEVSVQATPHAQACTYTQSHTHTHTYTWI